MQNITSTPKLSLQGTSLVQITDASSDLANVSTESLDVNIQRIAGAALAATNALGVQLSTGAAYYDARQIRALTNSDIVKAQIQDNAGNGLTSQASGGQRALDVGIDVAGVQVDPRQIRALTASDVVTAAQGAAAALSGSWPVKITDGTNLIDPRMIVDGTTPTQKAKVDTSGRLWVYAPPATGNVTIQLVYDLATSTPVNANEWQDILSYTVPTNYDLSMVQFQIVSAQAGDDARMVKRTAFGSYVSSTNTFTDGSALTSPEYAASLYVYITTLIGNVANDTVTITYTNQAGTTGRTATVVINKNTAVGSRQQVTLQATDFGVIDVTNVTHTSTGQAGAWNIEGTTALVYETAGVINVESESVFSLNASSISQGNTAVMQYRTSAAGAKARRINLIGTLIPRT